MAKDTSARRALQEKARLWGQQHPYRALGLGLLALAAAFGTFAGVVRIVAWALGAESKAIAVVVVGLPIWLMQQSVLRRHDRERQLADKKREQYLKFLDVMKTYMPTGEAAVGSNTDQVDRLRQVSLAMTITASDEVVLAWNRVRSNAVRLKGTPPTAPPALAPAALANLRTYSDLMLRMRKDSGFPNTKLTRSDMLATFINDIDYHRAVVDAEE